MAGPLKLRVESRFEATREVLAGLLETLNFASISNTESLRIYNGSGLYIETHRSDVGSEAADFAKICPLNEAGFFSGFNSPSKRRSSR